MDERTIARFWSKVDRRGPDDCWEWTAAKGRAGYGAFQIRSNGRWRARLAHRVSFALSTGRTIDEVGALFVCHRCDNPACVNPAHLFLGTHQENVDDMRAKGRGQRGSGHYIAKLTEADAREIRRAYASGATQHALALKYGVDQSAISCLVRGKTWKHVAAPAPGG